ncbi:MAG: hypothetical protein AAF654_06460 [Myxococcota bacterium]
MASAYENALIGDFDGEDGTAGVGTLRRSMAFAAGLAVHPVTLDDVSDTPDLAGSLTCLQEVRSASVSFRKDAVEGWLAKHRRCHAPGESRSRIALALSEAWVALQGAPTAGLIAHLAELERASRQAGFAELLLEAASLRALAAAADDRPQATQLARRASRMSRTESMPQLEYLANLTLAALRRLNGEPHLAARIVGAIRRVAPPLWHGWCDWELLLAGVRPEGQHRTTRTLTAWLDGRMRGETEQDRSLAALAEGLPHSIRHIDLVLAALSPAAETEQAWLSGRVDDLPGELCGLARLRGPAPADESALAYVYVNERGRARRFLPLGYAPLGHPLPQGRRKQARTAALVSTLALANGAACPVEETFERIYGFAYQPEIHHSVFNVLIHRARKYLEQVGEIARDELGLSLRLERPILVPDPRCFPPEHDRVLQAIAAYAAPLTAKDASSAAGVSLRVAQIALKELVEDGFCRLEKSGRESRYVVEDTTFREPTVHR